MFNFSLPFQCLPLVTMSGQDKSEKLTLSSCLNCRFSFPQTDVLCSLAHISAFNWHLISRQLICMWCTSTQHCDTQHSSCDQTRGFKSGSTQWGFALQNTSVCPSVPPLTRAKEWGQLQQKAFACSGVTQQTLLPRESARLTVQRSYFYSTAPG